jgi:2-methylcitrate dehydratase
MSTVNRGVRIASKTLRSPALRAPLLRAPPLAAKRVNFAPSIRSTTAKFSTMTPLQSGAPQPPQAREYDPEIKDIASYIHHTPIESDLAVSS